MPDAVKRVLLHAEGDGRTRERVRRLLREYGIQEVSEGYDAVIEIGTDGDLLKLLQILGVPKVPVFHVSPPGYSTFYSSVDWDQLRPGLERLSRGDYRVEQLTRLRVCVGNNEPVYALNELALFPSRSATLMEYSLVVDDEVLWSDKADGIIVATPAGSTAYAFSAGGPMVLKGAPVFVLVPVNSLNPIRRSLVVPDESRMVIRDISSQVNVEAILDGVARVRVNGAVTVERGESISLIRFTEKVGENIERKVKLTLESQDIPPSAKFVLKMLQIYGEATPKELVEKTGLPDRTIRYALSILVKKGIVKRVANPRNIQQRIYRVSRA
ncbi:MULTISPECIES: N-acetylmuramoyl-L-alanine amidase [Metallosphaera]|uniref:N-acetylmuramoyl-L-alanine amidase n=1 Tax=Metallosphaera TaxID=41980 RepID=UPI001F0709B2|nr:N-acetylmuramoyl-L-alanine amidase [Metallosphaera sedula]MCH1770359.1 N-acetylmuramoyl-L-alanine amidase [Metallosphaera sedula]MCP6727807.1 N-acetylmuramoyl-L-alanine amidase [Metallosphaera sedula]